MSEMGKVSGRLEQLLQLRTATWDGNLISKIDRDQLYNYSLITRTIGGWNVISEEGIEVLVKLGYMDNPNATPRQ